MHEQTPSRTIPTLTIECPSIHPPHRHHRRAGEGENAALSSEAPVVSSNSPPLSLRPTSNDERFDLLRDSFAVRSDPVVDGAVLSCMKLVFHKRRCDETFLSPVSELRLLLQRVADDGWARIVVAELVVCYNIAIVRERFDDVEEVVVVPRRRCIHELLTPQPVDQLIIVLAQYGQPLVEAAVRPRWVEPKLGEDCEAFEAARAVMLNHELDPANRRLMPLTLPLSISAAGRRRGDARERRERERERACVREEARGARECRRSGARWALTHRCATFGPSITTRVAPSQARAFALFSA